MVFLHTPTSDTLNVLPAGRAGWVRRGMERAREAACVVCRAWCVVRGRSLCRRAEEQLTVICVETETAALTKGVWISSQTCTLLLWWPALSATSSDFFRACDCEGNPADECVRVERPPGAVPQYHVRRWTSEPTFPSRFG